MEEKISAIMVIHNSEKIIRRALKSLKGVVDEILILHDGPCNDKSIEICKEYTTKVFVTPENKGVPGMILPILFRKVKYPWILKIDDDEFLSPDLKKNLRELTKAKNIDGYNFLWPYWDKEKYITKKWPRKMALYRKSKMSYFGFPHWDDPKISGTVVNSDYQLEHRHYGQSAVPTWEQFKKKGLGRYMRLQAEYTVKDYKEFDKFQHSGKDFPFSIRLRRKFPIMSAIPFAIFAFFKTMLSEGAYKEGRPVFMEASRAIIYYLALGLKVHKLQIEMKKVKKK